MQNDGMRDQVMPQTRSQIVPSSPTVATVGVELYTEPKRVFAQTAYEFLTFLPFNQRAEEANLQLADYRINQ